MKPSLADYARWRDWKLENAPREVEELIVEVRDPAALSPAEHGALRQRIERCNMAIYVSSLHQQEAIIPRQLGKQFGLERLDANWLAEGDGISEIRVNHGGTRSAYIPYTDLPIKWHTDGYYNPPQRTIRGLVLHCARSAAQGGENRVMDHEMLYLRLRDTDPRHIDALMQPDVMTIPERVDETDGIRQQQAGPVFSVDALSGTLHMRYTARTRSIEWKQDEDTMAALAALEKLLVEDTRNIFELRLEPGVGLLCNNVLHDRAGFIDHPDHPRLLYRARYYDRICPRVS